MLSKREKGLERTLSGKKKKKQLFWLWQRQALEISGSFFVWYGGEIEVQR